MSPQMSDLPTCVGPKEVAPGHWELFGGKLYHLVLQAQQEAWAFAEALPLDTSIQDLMNHTFFRIRLWRVLEDAFTSMPSGKDLMAFFFSGEDLMAFFFWIGHPGDAANFLVKKTGEHLFDPAMFSCRG